MVHTKYRQYTLLVQLTPAEQQRRERLRLQAAERFARGDGINEIAHDLRVTPGSVRRWRRTWRDGGPEALRSKGPVSREKLSPQQWARREAELRKGPLAHGFAGDQRWTLGRIKTLIGKLFHVGYTVEGVWKLMGRHGWSCQVPVRQALERDEDAVAVWKDQVWPDIKAPLATWAPTSASRTRQRPRRLGTTDPHLHVTDPRTRYANESHQAPAMPRPARHPRAKMRRLSPATAAAPPTQNPLVVADPDAIFA